MAGDVTYQGARAPSAALASLLNSAEMQAHMSSVGSDAAQSARSYSNTPNSIMSEVVKAAVPGSPRWAVNVINTHPSALVQEYGTKRRPPLHPLISVLDRFWISDPHRRRGRIR